MHSNFDYNFHICFNLSSRENAFNSHKESFLWIAVNFFIHQRKVEIKKNSKNYIPWIFICSKLLPLCWTAVCLGVKIPESLFFQDLIGIIGSTACLEYWYREVWDYGHEFEQTPGDREGQGCLLCCSQWDP